MRVTSNMGGSPWICNGRESIARRSLFWTVWALMLVAGIWFVAVYGFTMPYVDEWAWLPVVAGQEPVSLSWLWSMHNEHRMVLPRLIYMGLGLATDFNFQAGSFFNIFALGALSAAMMLTARAIRGRTSFYDAFFPLLLMHWAQYENIVWGFQLNFIMSVALAGMILMTVVRCGPQLRLRAAVLITLCLIGLGDFRTLRFGLSAGDGMLARVRRSLPLARRGSPCPARRAVDACVCRRLAACWWASTSSASICRSAIRPAFGQRWAPLLQFLSGGVGSAAKETWPVSGVLVVVACVYALRQLYIVFRDQPAERLRVAGLFCFLGGVGSLALAIGMGRACRRAESRFHGTLHDSRRAAAVVCSSCNSPSTAPGRQDPSSAHVRPVDARPAGRSIRARGWLSPTIITG